jgi:hypothetical protein
MIKSIKVTTRIMAMVGMGVLGIPSLVEPAAAAGGGVERASPDLPISSPQRSAKDEMIIKNNPIARAMFGKPGSDEWAEVWKNSDQKTRDEFSTWSITREEDDLPLRGQKKKGR